MQIKRASVVFYHCKHLKAASQIKLAGYLFTSVSIWQPSSWFGSEEISRFSSQGIPASQPSFALPSLMGVLLTQPRCVIVRLDRSEGVPEVGVSVGHRCQIGEFRVGTGQTIGHLQYLLKCTGLGPCDSVIPTLIYRLGLDFIFVVPRSTSWLLDSKAHGSIRLSRLYQPTGIFWPVGYSEVGDGRWKVPEVALLVFLRF